MTSPSERKTKKQKAKTKQKQDNSKKQTNKKRGTGAVQDKPFDELLMFIVGKDSALFSGLSKTGGSAPFRFKCSSSSFSSFVIWRISARRNLNCQNSSESLNLSKGFVLPRKIRFLRSNRLWRWRSRIRAAIFNSVTSSEWCLQGGTRSGKLTPR